MEGLILCPEEAGFIRAGNHGLKGKKRKKKKMLCKHFTSGLLPAWILSPMEHTAVFLHRYIGTMHGGLVRALQHRSGIKIA